MAIVLPKSELTHLERPCCSYSILRLVVLTHISRPK